ncbi:MAG TPA: hypothetical protein VKC51_08355 [Lacunisphaera sp.]|nr:hypothetical protein [Lacunisphaera sp.]
MNTLSSLMARAAVPIEDTVFDTGADCIAIKAGHNNDGIRFTDCVFRGVTQTELVQYAGNISFKNVTIDPANRKPSANSRVMDPAVTPPPAKP